MGMDKEERERKKKQTKKMTTKIVEEMKKVEVVPM